mmetsp:Transcript_12591/g.23249  ORF Transcript_12591/g.23249 Transcript_12591/m.23249 type:complete len:346 (+) Transcript_12591:60-1097(+)
MESKADGGGSFESIPPPVGGLGNYKGVMLCTRPTTEARPPVGEDGKPPFRPPPDMMASEPLGLAPPIGRRLRARDEVKTRGPSAALRRHVQWLKDLQVQVKEDQQKFEDEELKDVAKKQRMQQIFKQQRHAVRALKAKHVEEGGPDCLPSRKDLEAVLHNRKGGKSKEDGEEGKVKGGLKPLWAMTVPEKDAFEEEEAMDLINFADGLDYEKYIGDLEFRQCLEVLRDRAKRLQKEQDNFKDALLRDLDVESGGAESVDGEVQAQAPGALRARVAEAGHETIPLEDRPDWDASTVCSERQGAGPARDLRTAAGQLLEAAPHLRGVHSKESMQRLIEKSMAAETAA